MVNKLPIFSIGENKFTSNYTDVLDLGIQPWGNDYRESLDLPKYPLKLVYCHDSELLQLSHFVPKEVMFKQHSYLSGTSKSLIDHFAKITKENIDQFQLDSKSIVIDIGGNDGSQALQYINQGITQTFNIESASNIADISRKNGVNTINDFACLSTFTKNFQAKSVKLINGSGIFFHMEELHSVLNGIKHVLADDGVLVIQFMYAGSMVENHNFDTIYHEHLCYYTVQSIKKLLNLYGLRLFDAYQLAIHSGTIIAKFCHNHALFSQTQRCIDTITEDRKYDLDAFLKFGQYISQNRFKLRNFLNELKTNNKTIYAYGAPVKGATLLNYENIDKTIITKAVEVNKLKIGKYIPGTDIPVVFQSENDLPDYFLILSHNLTDSIIKDNQKLIKNGVQFIVPFPEIKII